MEEHRVAGLLIFVLGLCGFNANLFVVFFLRKSRCLSSSFGILTLNQSITDLINSTVFCFLVAPIVFFVLPAPAALTARMGQLLFLAYDCCSWSHLLITLNRFCSLYAPSKYPHLFSNTSTAIYVGGIWLVAIGINFFEYVIIDCAFWLPVGHWNFEFKRGPMCPDIEWYLNYCRNMVITAFIAILDVATLIKFHFVNQMTRTATGGDTAAMKSRKRQELFFLAQAMLQSLLFYIELVCCYNLGAIEWMGSPWAQFSLRTVCWVAVHGLDGAITLICNRDFRRLVSSLFCGRGSGGPLFVSTATNVSVVSKKN